MSETVWLDGRWFYDVAKAKWFWLEPGRYLPDHPLDAQGGLHYGISSEKMRLLIERLDAEGWLKPRLDERLREEDLKITHRLLDIITQMVPTSFRQGNPGGPVYDNSR